VEKRERERERELHTYRRQVSPPKSHPCTYVWAYIVLAAAVAKWACVSVPRAFTVAAKTLMKLSALKCRRETKKKNRTDRRRQRLGLGRPETEIETQTETKTKTSGFFFNVFVLHSNFEAIRSDSIRKSKSRSNSKRRLIDGHVTIRIRISLAVAIKKNATLAAALVHWEYHWYPSFASKATVMRTMIDFNLFGSRFQTPKIANGF